MDNYYVEFIGELKDDQEIVERFAKHYNNVCDIVNAKIAEWNKEFDEQWNGEPIKDYSKNEEYQEWILKQYKHTLVKEKMDVDDLLRYWYDDECQLYGIGKHGNIKEKRIKFVLRKG